MLCADVGLEAWLFVGMTAPLVVALLFRARQTQRWMREHPRVGHGFGLHFGLERVLDEEKLWAFRLLFVPIPFVLWLASVDALYCFFHGLDYPPLR